MRIHTVYQSCGTHCKRPAVRALLICLTVCVVAPSAMAQSRDRYREQRIQMVEEYLVKEGLTNRRVLGAMLQVPRHEFVRPAQRRQAYTDGALAIGHQQTISPPFIVAYMTTAIDPQPSERVLEIGTGSGYQAAVLSELAKEVYSIEIVEPLGKSAARLLKKLEYNNVHVKVGDGYQGWSEHAPFDKIIVTCSPEDVPAPLIAQLRDGGKMIVPLGERYQQVFYLFEKRDGALVQQKLIPTLFVPMTGISEEKRDVQPDPLNPQIVNGGFEDDANDDGRVDNWHYQRQTELLTDDAPEGTRYLKFENQEVGRLAQVLQGFPVDGSKISSLRVELQIKVDDIQPGPNAWEKPALVVHFYDRIRRPIGEEVIGPWMRSSDWRESWKTMRVPPNAREAIMRIGLNGATGTLCVDNVTMSPR